jgi:hypothetical protein|nr:MAG TPA: hypothetical protein [Caudoviricetes sp.]
MSRKRKCRYTPEELALHKEAVRLRNMTDKQLVEEFHRAADTELVVSSPSVAQDGTEAAGPIGDTSAVKMLVTALAEGKCKGIKSATAYKVAQLATEMGLM